MELAKVVNCEQGEDDACDRCLSCRKVSGLKHPDVKVLLPVPPGVGPERVGALLQERVADPYGLSGARVDGSISIEAVRELQREGSLRPFEGKRKVAIILEADRMTVQAANALLKTLEEPPGGMLLILTSARPHALLPTIVSRCQPIRFGPLWPEEVEWALTEHLSLEANRARLVAHLSGGSLKRAGELLKEEVTELRDEALRLLQTALSGDHLKALDLAEHIWRAGGRDMTLHVLRLVLIWFGDLFRLSHRGEEETLANSDRLEELWAMAQVWGPQGAESGINLTEDIIGRIERNVSPRLALTAFLFQLGERVNPKLT